MRKVLLINQNLIPHYRVPVYSRLSEHLKKDGFSLTVASGGIQKAAQCDVRFEHREMDLSFLALARYIRATDPETIIFWVNLRNLYLFPTLLFARALGKKIVYWGHGRDLLDRDARLKNIAYAFEHRYSDAILLYAEHLKKYVSPRYHGKVFVANNTLDIPIGLPGTFNKDSTLERFKITTRKNIICVGRMQKRKRIGNLIEAFRLLDRPDTGLILAGPDTEGVLDGIEGDNVFKLGPVYDDDKLALLSAVDVYCLPGALGLSIVDAFYCGLPVVTEDGDESPEIMYLKDGQNGFIVPFNDTAALAEKLGLLLDDDRLRERFSREARNEIIRNGNIDLMCRGFANALRYVSA